MQIEKEPRDSGAVVRVHTERSKYPEVWVASNINIGRWYPDSETWLTSSARRDLPDGAEWRDLLRRGRVELLTSGRQEAYEAGWRAGVVAAANAAEEVEYNCPVVAADPGVCADPADTPRDCDPVHGDGC